MADKEHTGILTEEEFNALYENFSAMYINIACSYVHDLSTAEDIVNESFIRLWNKRGEVQSRNYESYMFSIVTNRCLDHLKSLKVKEKNLEEIQNSSMALLDFEINSLEGCNPTNLFKSEIMELLSRSLDKMPGNAGAIFLANRNEGLTYEEIAARFGIPVRKVTAEIQTALKFLRADLKDYLPLALVAFIFRSFL